MSDPGLVANAHTPAYLGQGRVGAVVSLRLRGAFHPHGWHRRALLGEAKVRLCVSPGQSHRMVRNVFILLRPSH